MAKKLVKKRKSPIKTKKRTVKKVVKKAKKKVLAIPKGYNSITPYLIVANAAKAIEFYKNIFGAKVAMLMNQPSGRVMHSELKIGDSKIMLADEFPEMNARGPQAFGGSPITMHLYVKNVDSIVEKAVASGAKLLRPVEDMFYGDRCGAVEDPFGHKWHVSTHIEDVTPAQMKKRSAQMGSK